MATRIELPDDWGEALLCEPGQHRARNGDSARAYDHCGRQLVWDRSASAFNARCACDIEAGGRPVDEMAARFGIEENEFRRRWVVAEVLAKLHQVPILIWLRTQGLNEPVQEGNPATHILVREWPALDCVAAFGFLENAEHDSWN